MSHVRRSAVLAAIALAIAVPAWFFLAPRPLGGKTSFVVVARGTSMEPALHAGDLALVRRAPSYLPGDAVAFRSRDIGRVVLHRIVRLEGDRFVTRGDANDFLDPYRPVPADILGTLWVRVPLAGRALSLARSPPVAAGLVGLLALVALATLGASSGSRGARRGSPSPSPTSSRAAVLARMPGGAVLIGGVALFFVAVIVGSIAFLRPQGLSRSTEVPYRHRGHFSYSSPVPPSPIYRGGRLRTGDPVFLRLTRTLPVAFSYRFMSPDTHDVSGSIRLVAELGDGLTPWHHAITLSKKARFRGDEARARGTLDLVRLRTLIARVESLTGIDRVTYTVAVQPSVLVDGVAGGAPLHDSFAPALHLQLDDQILQLVAGQTEPLAPSEASSVRVSTRETATFPGSPVPVASARAAAVAAAAVALLLACAAGSRLARALQRDEPTRNFLRYGPWMVPVSGASTPGSRPIVEVGSMDGLARIADSVGCPILYEDGGASHAYFVEEGRLRYMYRTLVDPPEPTIVAEPPALHAIPTAVELPPPPRRVVTRTVRLERARREPSRRPQSR